MNIVVVGAGIYGVTAARELARRGHGVTLVDRDAIPHVDAATTDLQKAVRLDYGDDRFFTEWARDAMLLWPEWDAAYQRECGGVLYHEDGFLFLTKDPIQPDSFEAHTLAMLRELDWEVETLDRRAVRRRYALFDGYAGGYFNPKDGWAESGKVLEWILRSLPAEGVTIHDDRDVTGFVTADETVQGVTTTRGELRADLVLVAAGSWSSYLVPELAAGREPLQRCVGQSVFYLEVKDESVFQAPRLPTFSADISRTGWYGFPAFQGVVKVANHGVGRDLGPDDSREVPDADEARLRTFLTESLPALRKAPVNRRRVCPYADTFDGNFLIDHVPGRPGLAVATGGSGHGFKFAPLLGSVIADVVEGTRTDVGAHFAWREPSARTAEEARCMD